MKCPERGRIFWGIVIWLGLMMFFSGSVLAAPAKLSGEEKSTAKLVELAKPDDDYSTYSNFCIISGKSKQGVRITIYTYKETKDTYEKLIIEDKVVSWVVGASGVFVKEIELEKNKVNKILIYAEKDDDFQIIKREITVKSGTLKEILKNEILKIEDLLSKVVDK